MIGRPLSPEESLASLFIPPVDRARARIVPVRWLAPGTVAMTLGRVVLVRRSHEHDTRLIAHELVHVRQWRQHGTARFLCRYLGDYLDARRRGMSHGDAYRAIAFEAEARALAGL